MRSIRPSCRFFPPARLDCAHYGCLTAQRPDCNHKKHHDEAENHTGIKQGSHIKAVIQYTRNSYTLQLNDKQETMIPLSKQSEKELQALLGY